MTVFVDDAAGYAAYTAPMVDGVKQPADIIFVRSATNSSILQLYSPNINELPPGSRIMVINRTTGAIYVYNSQAGATYQSVTQNNVLEAVVTGVNGSNAQMRGVVYAGQLSFD